MAKNEKNYKKNKTSPNNSRLKTETKHGIWAIVFFVLALFLFMSAFNFAGPAGQFFYNIFSRFTLGKTSRRPPGVALKIFIQ